MKDKIQLILEKLQDMRASYAEAAEDNCRKAEAAYAHKKWTEGNSFTESAEFFSTKACTVDRCIREIYRINEEN